MSSKFIPKSRIKTQVFNTEWSNFLKKDDSNYISFASPEKDLEEDKKYKEEKNHMRLEKERIESIPLGDLTFRDLYKFPFHRAKYGSWVYDANSNFIFQFEFRKEETRDKVVGILNGEDIATKNRIFRNDNGMIQIFYEDIWHDAILIRGWGNLTGVGAYNLDGEYAAKIQDTLADYIVEELNK